MSTQRHDIPLLLLFSLFSCFLVLVPALAKGEKLAQGTNSTDVKALGLLQKSFIRLQDSNGDPCLPSAYTWDWVTCNADTDSPRVTALNLSGLGLVGMLPDFSAMSALESIDLHNNNLTQDVPEFLGMFPKLKILNLADNNFSGTVPSSISNNVKLMFNALGNPYLSCTNTSECNTRPENLSAGNANIESEPRSPSPNNGKSSKPLSQPIKILLITLAFILVLLVTVGWIFYTFHLKNKRYIFS